MGSYNKETELREDIWRGWKEKPLCQVTGAVSELRSVKIQEPRDRGRDTKSEVSGILGHVSEG